VVDDDGLNSSVIVTFVLTSRKTTLAARRGITHHGRRTTSLHRRIDLEREGVRNARIAGIALS
jgi:hypothetical protein